MRFHVHAHVEDLQASIAFHSKMFGADPIRIEHDYAKWHVDPLHRERRPLHHAEALLNSMAGDRFVAYSAGSHPIGVVNPLAVEELRRLRIPTDGLRSKGWDAFATLHAVP